MNYQMHYARLVERSRDRTIEGYSEKHHIVPKCIGGSNNHENIVTLTPEEHFVAHQLLVKIYPKNYKLLWATISMTNGTQNMQRSNKLYGWLRRCLAEEMSKRMTGRKMNAEFCEKARQRQLGVSRGPHKEETKQKMSKASKGIKKSKAHRLAMSKAQTGLKRPRTKEHNEKIRKSNIKSAKRRDFSHLQDPEYKQRQSEKMREVWAKRKAGDLPMPNNRKEINNVVL